MMSRNLILSVAAAALVLPSMSTAQNAAPATAPAAAPADLTVLQPIPNDYQPKKTAWGEPDLRGTWPIDNIASLPFQRPKNFGNRFYLTDEEYKARLEQAAGSDARTRRKTRTTPSASATGSNPTRPAAKRRCWCRRPTASSRRSRPRRRSLQGRPLELERAPVRLDRRLRHVGPLHHPRLPRLDVPVPLQQRHPDLPGAGQSRDQPRDDPRFARHSGGAQGAVGRAAEDPLEPEGAHLDGPVARLLGGREHAGGRDHQHHGRRQRERGCAQARPFAAQHGDDGRAAVQHDPDRRERQSRRAAYHDRRQFDHLRADLRRSRRHSWRRGPRGSIGPATRTTASSSTRATRATCRCATTSTRRAPSVA